MRLFEAPRDAVFAAWVDPRGQPLFEVLTTVTFAEEGGKTMQTLRAQVVSSTAAERLDALLLADREITATRIVDAPREVVFAMWTDPAHVGHWWGPNAFTNTIEEMDVRPGGVWRFVMHGPDGTDYKNRSVFDEVVQPERLVYSHVSGPTFRMTATFGAHGDQTRLVVRMRFDSAAQRDKVAGELGAVEGLGQTLDRLEAYVAGRTRG